MGLFDMAKAAGAQALGNQDVSTLFAQFSGKGPMIELLKVVQGQGSLADVSALLQDPEQREQLISQIMQFTGIKFDAATSSFTHGEQSYPADAEGLIAFVKAFLGK